MKTTLEPEDLAGACVFFASDDAKFVHRPDPRDRRRPRHARLSVDPSVIGGWVETEFEPVLDAFAANFDERGEVGAAVCVYRRRAPGRRPVGRCRRPDDRSRRGPRTRSSLVFSSTKGVTAVCANLLIERGQLDPDATVATYWPEFAAGGKDAITVRQVLSHQAGLPLGRRRRSRSTRCSRGTRSSSSSRAQEPIWEPGTKHGYHMRTFGWLVGELIRRVDGHDGRPLPAATRSPTRSASTSGSVCPRSSSRASRHSCRRAPTCGALLAPLRDRAPARARLLDNPSELFNYDDMWNTRALHARGAAVVERHRRARVPSRGCTRRCVGDGSTACGRCSRRRSRPRPWSNVRRPDAVIIEETAFGLGFMLGSSVRRGQSRRRVRPRRRGRFAVVRRSRAPASRSAT